MILNRFIESSVREIYRQRYMLLDLTALLVLVAVVVVLAASRLALLQADSVLSLELSSSVITFLYIGLVSAVSLALLVYLFKGIVVLDRLRTTEMAAQSILETMLGAVIISDANGKVLFINLEAEKIFAYDEGELLGKELPVLIPEFNGISPSGFRGDESFQKSEIWWYRFRVVNLQGFGRGNGGRNIC